MLVAAIASRPRDTGGTGLGLAIVKAFVELRGGQVFAQSEGKNKGCTFGFSLLRTFL
jgi:signal transduction histidine kinase